MHRLTITAKIWLSIGIVILGFVFTTVFNQIQGVDNEQRLRRASLALFPAAVKSEEATTLFQRSMQVFGEAVSRSDARAVDRAFGAGQVSASKLHAIGATSGLDPLRGQTAVELAAAVAQFMTEARASYGAIAQSGVVSSTTEPRVVELQARAQRLLSTLKQYQDQCAEDLQRELMIVQTRSVNSRWITLIAFLSTLIVTTILVDLTIRFAITRPLVKSNASLARERDLLRILLDNIPDCIYYKDAQSRFIRVNRAESRLLRIDDESTAVGKTDFDFFDREHAQEAFDDEREILRSGVPLICKVERTRTEGPIQWLTSTKVPVRDESGCICGLVGISRNVTDWHDATDALRKSEESFRLLFSAIPNAVWVYDARTLEFLEVNETAIRQYGYSAQEFASLSVLDLHPPLDSVHLANILAVLDPAHPPTGSRKLNTKDGQTLEVEVSAHVLEFKGRRAVLEVAQDISDRKRLEVELRHAQRLEAVGQLAAGIAHEINTPIQYLGDNTRFISDAFRQRQSVIALYEQLRLDATAGKIDTELLDRLSKTIESADMAYLTEEIPRAVAQSLDGVNRVATIVRAMKEFAHPGRKEMAAADLNTALSNALIVAKNEYKYVADVETDFGDLPPVICHLADLNQVFLNLLVNAAHAIAEANKETQARGKIRIQTRCRDGRALISISDTGCGIPDTIRAKVFDPFFTTKEVGRGTGQGLTIARTIVVEKHRGSLTFEPNGDTGTIFHIAVPLEPAPVAAAQE